MNLAFNFITPRFKDSRGKHLAFYLRYIDYICFFLGIAAPILMIVNIGLEDQTNIPGKSSYGQIILRIAALASTGVLLVFLWKRYNIYLNLQIFKNQQPVGSIHLIQQAKLFNSSYKSDFLFEVIFCCIVLPPGADFNLSIYNDTQGYTEYYPAYILVACIQLFRAYLFVRVVIQKSEYMSFKTYKVCEKCECFSNQYQFVYKCENKQKHFFILMPALLGYVLILSYGLLQAQKSNQAPPSTTLIWSNFGLCIWAESAALTTVGYGDAIPQTLIGRLLIIGCAVLGPAFFSFSVVSLVNFSQFSHSESLMYEKIIFAYEEIELKYYAAQSIWLAWKYYRDNLRGNRKQKKILNKRKHVKVLNTFISSLNSFVELKILINEQKQNPPKENSVIQFCQDSDYLLYDVLQNLRNLYMWDIQIYKMELLYEELNGKIDKIIKKQSKQCEELKKLIIGTQQQEEFKRIIQAASIDSDLQIEKDSHAVDAQSLRENINKQLRDSDKLQEYNKCIKDIQDNFKLGVVRTKVYNNQGELKKIAERMKTSPANSRKNEKTRIRSRGTSSNKGLKSPDTHSHDNILISMSHDDKTHAHPGSKFEIELSHMNLNDSSHNGLEQQNPQYITISNYINRRYYIIKMQEIRKLSQKSIIIADTNNEMNFSRLVNYFLDQLVDKLKFCCQCVYRDGMLQDHFEQNNILGLCFQGEEEVKVFNNSLILNQREIKLEDRIWKYCNISDQFFCINRNNSSVTWIDLSNNLQSSILIATDRIQQITVQNNNLILLHNQTTYSINLIALHQALAVTINNQSQSQQQQQYQQQNIYSKDQQQPLQQSQQPNYLQIINSNYNQQPLNQQSNHLYTQKPNINPYTQTPIDQFTINPPKIYSPLQVRFIAATQDFTIILTIDGQLYSTGDNYFGQLGLGTVVPYIPTPTKISAFLQSNVIQVAVGLYHSVALTDDGQVFTWGLGTSGQLIPKKNIKQSTKPLLTELPAQFIACGMHSTWILTAQNQVYYWGKFGQQHLLFVEEGLCQQLTESDCQVCEIDVFFKGKKEWVIYKVMKKQKPWINHMLYKEMKKNMFDCGSCDLSIAIESMKANLDQNQNN